MSRSTLSLLLVVVVLLAGCGDDAEVSIDDEETGDTESTATEVEDDEGDEDGLDDGGATDEEEPASPQPDPEEMADPCADRDEQATDVFIDVVSPVEGQHVEDEIELVGCSSVYEGTVRYRLVTDEGEELVDDFTTAECGGPCVGAFDTTIDLAAADGQDAATLEVFWDSPADGEGERDLQEISLVLG